MLGCRRGRERVRGQGLGTIGRPGASAGRGQDRARVRGGGQIGAVVRFVADRWDLGATVTGRDYRGFRIIDRLGGSVCWGWDRGRVRGGGRSGAAVRCEPGPRTGTGRERILAVGSGAPATAQQLGAYRALICMLKSAKKDKT